MNALHELKLKDNKTSFVVQFFESIINLFCYDNIYRKIYNILSQKISDNLSILSV